MTAIRASTSVSVGAHDPTVMPRQVPKGAGAATLTFWSRSLWPRNQSGFRVVATDDSGRWKVINTQNNGNMQENGVFSINSLGYGLRIYVWDAALANYYTRYFPFAANATDMGQRFLLSPNQGLPVLAAWRFLAVRVDFNADHITFFLDGRRALDWQVESTEAKSRGAVTVIVEWGPKHCAMLQTMNRW